jgi:hypothetical protein
LHRTSGILDRVIDVGNRLTNLAINIIEGIEVFSQIQGISIWFGGGQNPADALAHLIDNLLFEIG